MIFLVEIPLLLLLVITAGGAILVRDLISAVLILGTYSFFLAVAWAWLGAVDVAFVESVVVRHEGVLVCWRSRRWLRWCNVQWVWVLVWVWVLWDMPLAMCRLRIC